MVDLFLTNMQHFTSQDINWWTGVVWITCDVLISCLDSHSDGTHSLQSIHRWASDVMCSDGQTNSSNTSDGVHFQQKKYLGGELFC